MLRAIEPSGLCSLVFEFVPSEVKRGNKLGSVVKGPLVGIPLVEAYGVGDSFDTFGQERIFFVSG